MADLLARPLDTDAFGRLLRDYPGPAVSLLDVRDMLARLGVRASGVKASIDYLRALRSPAVVHLAGPQHFCVFLDASDEWTRVLDEGEVKVLQRSVFEERFTGNALVVLSDLPAGPLLHIPHPHLAIKRTDPGVPTVVTVPMLNLAQGGQSLDVELDGHS
ncbi:MAG: hypothetical protein COZ06_39190 [Armatimonadetes bacterium CG_4_10_14_3_um_filter_66_18]|nr:MAG: hypothetical protein COZ06_39190 [Armatimonadetes bacterium CG_4_10_14_3_um_filter_66_18]PIZ45474.1 MAG: hypothetical protein COY42_12170 [Armatimonadetes bacterium CG_4_10_14_0_8_um_filter_66_14]PJB60894.1 MAG: hypothetical protein CO096_31585 [Armatimonadetes bacterium CG_4_9_14_3_um_filter_66_14]